MGNKHLEAMFQEVSAEEAKYIILMKALGNGSAKAVKEWDKKIQNYQFMADMGYKLLEEVGESCSLVPEIEKVCQYYERCLLSESRKPKV